MNWRLVTRPLTRAAQLDLRGDPDSGGVWAPCLSHADGLFWLIYTDMKRFDGNFKDAHNYLVTAPAITGPWSDPIYLNSSGFDPSLFHDDDGRKWFLNQQWRHTTDSVGGRPRGTAFDGILAQEYDPVARRLTGPIRTIFAGSPHALVEGPHLHKRDGWYYLTTAEGGTGYDHTVTMARSRSLHGPYELHPSTFLLTSKDAPDAPLQRAGHGQIVETPDGLTYHTHLCTRPLPGTRRSPLGRETALQLCTWGDDGWLRLAHGGLVPAVEVPSPRGRPRARARRARRIPLRRPRPPVRLPVAPHPLPRAPLHPDRRRPPPPRPRVHRLVVRAIPRRPPPAAPRLPRRDPPHRLRPRHLPAGRRPHDLLQPHQVPLPRRHPRRRTSAASSPSSPAPATGPTESSPSPSTPRSPSPTAPSTSPSASPAPPSSSPTAPAANGPPPARALDASVISDEGGRGEHASFTGAFVGLAAFDTSGRAVPADFDRFSYAPG